VILEKNYMRQTSDVGIYPASNARVELLNNGKTDTIQILWVGITDGAPTGSILNTQSLAEVKTYPNPAITQLSIEIPDCNTAMQISVFNQLGMQVLGQSVNCNSGNGKIDIAPLPAGYYQGVCRLDDGKSYLLRFTKSE
jgi:Secretion system C-terminal sorting domain